MKRREFFHTSAVAGAVGLDCVDCVTIGAESRAELADLVKIPAAAAAS
jgi:hypothetical protein